MLDFMSELLNKFASLIVSVLPSSPVQKYLSSFADLPYLSWLNWFFPVSACITVAEAWLVAIGLFYIYSVILRWVKVID